MRPAPSSSASTPEPQEDVSSPDHSTIKLTWVRWWLCWLTVGRAHGQMQTRSAVISFPAAPGWRQCTSNRTWLVALLPGRAPPAGGGAGYAHGLPGAARRLVDEVHSGVSLQRVRVRTDLLVSHKHEPRPAAGPMEVAVRKTGYIIILVTLAGALALSACAVTPTPETGAPATTVPQAEPTTGAEATFTDPSSTAPLWAR